MSFALNTTFRGHFRPLLWVCLATVALVGCAPKEVQALDPLGLEVAADEVRGALDRMADALNAAPRDVQTAISADLHLMSQAITRALGRVEDGPVPIVDPTLEYDLNFLTDIAVAATEELQAVAASDADGGGLAADRAARIDALSDAAAARVAEINLVTEGWAERGRDAVVELAEVDGALVVRTTDRLIYNGVRFTAIGLLLVGLLVVGLQLLRMSEDRVDSLTLLRETPLFASLSVIALGLFFAGCFVFSLRPGTLAALSAEIRQQPQEHPCERLAEQRSRLIAAQQVQHRGLIEATERRMVPAAQDCLGLPSEIATAEAIDLLAAKTAVAPDEPLRPEAASVAVAAAEPEPRADEANGTTLPALPAPQEPAQAIEFDALADLAAQIRDAEDALSERLDQAVNQGLEQAEAAPPPAPEPAAGPAAPAAEVETAAGSPGLDRPPEPGPPPAPEVKPAVAAALDGAADAELYVTTTIVNYREAPSVEARRLGAFVSGARLTVIGEDDGWAEVRLGDGREVFVASEFLEQAP